MAKKMTPVLFATHMAASGHPLRDKGREFYNLYRAARAAGVCEEAAYILVIRAYNAAQLYVWKFEEKGGCDDYGLARAVEAENARLHPNGKSAEDILARNENRPSRWGGPDHMLSGIPQSHVDRVRKSLGVQS